MNSGVVSAHPLLEAYPTGIVDLQRIVVGVVEVGHLTLEDAVLAVFDTEDCHTVLPEEFQGRVIVLTSYLEGMVNGGIALVIGMDWGLSLSQNQVIITALKKDHSWSLIKDTHA